MHALGYHASDNDKMSSALSLPILTIGRCVLAACAASPLHGLCFPGRGVQCTFVDSPRSSKPLLDTRVGHLR